MHSTVILWRLTAHLFLICMLSTVGLFALLSKGCGVTVAE
jgi:hypothetical protein